MSAYYSESRIVIITYNLKGPTNGYAQFYAALKDVGAWWHYIPSTWLVHTTKGPSEIAETLRVHLLAGDHIFVGTLQDGYGGWLPKDAWEWIKGKGLSP